MGRFTTEVSSQYFLAVRPYLCGYNVQTHVQKWQKVYCLWWYHVYSVGREKEYTFKTPTFYMGQSCVYSVGREKVYTFKITTFLVLRQNIRPVGNTAEQTAVEHSRG
jgi:hypothetical protein